LDYDTSRRLLIAAQLQADAAAALIKAMGMVAENKQREHLGQSMAYVDQDFENLTLVHGLGVNDIATRVQDGFTYYGG